MNWMEGPVIPIPTPFDEKERVDYEALAGYILFLREAGIRNVMTTVGTSRYNLLEEEEIREVNRIVVENAGKDMVTIVSDPPYGGTEKSIKFGEHAQKIGADRFLVVYPDRYYGEYTLTEFYEKISRSLPELGIMIHEMPMRNGLGAGNVPFSIHVLDHLLSLPNVKGVKEESLDPSYGKVLVDRFSSKGDLIGAGGGMSRYLIDYWGGTKTFLSGIGNFLPGLELRFFELMKGGDHYEASRIVYELEQPYFKVAAPIGWHLALKCALSIKGLLPPYERAPLTPPYKADRDAIRAFLEKMDWL